MVIHFETNVTANEANIENAKQNSPGPLFTEEEIIRAGSWNGRKRKNDNNSSGKRRDNSEILTTCKKGILLESGLNEGRRGKLAII